MRLKSIGAASTFSKIERLKDERVEFYEQSNENKTTELNVTVQNMPRK
jgi:hypothetical protein